MNLRLTTYEMTKISNLWDFHRRECQSELDSTLAYASGGGIGTRVLLTCGCGQEMDVTDYGSW